VPSPGGRAADPALPPPDGGDDDHDGGERHLDLAGLDQVAGDGEVEPAAAVDMDQAGLNFRGRRSPQE